MSELARHLGYAGTGVGIGLALGVTAWGLRRKWPMAGLVKGLSALLGMGGVAFIAAGLAIVGFMLRPMPEATRVSWFEGVDYERQIRRTPERAITHLVVIDLDRPGLRVLGTPNESDGKYQLRARTTSGFAKEFGAHVAINAGYYFPWHSNTLLDYYPHVSDPVSVIGVNMAEGQVYLPRSRPDSDTVVLCFSDDQAWIGTSTAGAQTAVAGFDLLRDGRLVEPLSPAIQPKRRHPRVAAGLRAGRRTGLRTGGRQLVLLVTDGRQPGYSLGLDVHEVAEVLTEAGVQDALLLDGGGSATLVRARDGDVEVVNTPVHGRIPPGVERPVANHLGFVVPGPVASP